MDLTVPLELFIAVPMFISHLWVTRVRRVMYTHIYIMSFMCMVVRLRTGALWTRSKSDV